MNLTELISELHKLYEEEPKVDEVKRLLKKYRSNPKDWKKFVTWDPLRYTRNLVDIGNGKFNLIILCWSESQGSAVHDHSDADCFVKVLDGELQETLYEYPQEKNAENEENPVSPLKQKGESTVFTKDQVTHIHDKQGVVHRMENPSHVDGCVSLHLYTPPFIMCNKFDDSTGQKSVATMSFDTTFGVHKKARIS